MQAIRSAAMASPSVSFRISRSAEDLAGTLHLLSQRLVRLEQRLEALELQRQASTQEDPGLEESLGNAERLLLDCRALLGGALDLEPASADDHPVVADHQLDGEPVDELDEEPAFAGDDLERQVHALGDDAAEDDGADTEISLFANNVTDSAAA